MKKTIITNLLVLVFILALGACSTTTSKISATETNCTDGLDDDTDDSIDCDDSDCDDDTSCADAAINDDPVDADGDGYYAGTEDCDDADGTINPGATETVGDGIDQDCDGSDLSDPSSGGTDADSDGYYSGTEATEDCDDSDSAINPAASEVLESGLVDENCDDFILQATETDCTDGVDNDGDTLIDCTDADCNADSACDSSTDVTETACADGADNDGDTYADCSDSDCSADASCATTTAVTLSTTDFGYPYDPTDGTVGMRWVSASGSNTLADGTANDCSTVTAPCADLTVALVNLAAGERIGVFEGTYEYTSDFLLTQAAIIDGGYYWETENTVLAANSRTHASTLEFTGASFVVRAPGKLVAITGLGFIGDYYPTVLQIINSSPVFASCRIRAGNGTRRSQAVDIRSTGIGGLMRPTFLNSQITVGDVTGVSGYNSSATAINAENLSTTTGTLVLVLRNNNISVGRVSVDDPATERAYAYGVKMVGIGTGTTVLNMWKNDLGLGISQNSFGIVGTVISQATIIRNSILVQGGTSHSVGVYMTSTALGTETLEIADNLISLNKNTPRTQLTSRGIGVTGFNTTVSSNTIVQGSAYEHTGISVDNTSTQTLSMTNNFLQSNGVTSSTMIALTGVPTSLNLSYNGFHFATAPITPLVFSDGTNMFATAVDLYGDGSTTGLFGAYATPTVTGNLDITADPLYWLGQRMVLDLVLNANAALIIDKGDSTLTVSATARDINGKARFVDGDNADGDSDATTGAVIDMGAAEAQP